MDQISGLIQTQNKIKQKQKSLPENKKYQESTQDVN